MSIYSADIKLMKAQRMTDTEDGGGRITGKQILDGEHNSIFSDISDLDRAYGSVDIKKTFLHVTSSAAEQYLGANVALLSPPQDESVSITIMSTGDHYDERSEARDRIERYLARSIRFDGLLLGDQLQGQRAIVLQLSLSAEQPAVNETLSLLQTNDAEEQEQYVRIVRVDSDIRSFTVLRNNQNYTFKRRVVTCEISEPLRYTFQGNEATDLAAANDKTTIHTTIVANASKYYGICALKQSANFGDMTLHTEGIFSQLVPSARSETPLIDLNVAGQLATLIATGNGQTVQMNSSNIAPNQPLYIGTSVLPGTLNINIGSASIADANGTLKLGELAVGSIDYVQGLLNFSSSCPDYSGQVAALQFEPAAAPENYSFSDSIAITSETRGYAYTYAFEKPPAPASLSLSYMAQGKWYRLTDGGNGILQGVDSSIGTGSLNATTGSLIITLGALPDVGSYLILQWSVNSSDVDRSNDFDTNQAWFVYQAENRKAMSPASVLIEWDDKQLSLADLSHGQLEILSPQKLRWQPLFLPASNTTYRLSYNEVGDEIKQLLTLDSLLVQLGEALTPGSLRFSLKGENLDFDAYNQSKAQWPELIVEDTIRDDGNGHLVNPLGDVLGQVDYASGELNINATFTASKVLQQQWYTLTDRIYARRYVPKAVTTVTPQEQTMTYIVARETQSIQMNLTPNLSLQFGLQDREQITSGSLRFTLNGETYLEQSNKLYYQFSTATGLGIEAGSIDRFNGEITIKQWLAGPYSCHLQSFTTTIVSEPFDSKVVFRTPGAPIASQSLYIDIPNLGSAAANEQGDIVGNSIHGHIDYQTGVIHLNTLVPFDASTVRYNCVVHNYLPLNSELIGLDPVRLPTDGRVPIYTVGDVVVVHQSEQRKIAALHANQTEDCQHSRCAEISLLDSHGEMLSDALFSIDLDAGTLTTAADFPTQDVTLSWRWEDLLLLRDVDISGELSCAKPISHDYDAGTAYVSSVCIAGDLWARYSSLFDQQTWTGEWSDSVIGNVTNAAFNDADFALTLTNEGAITERWALIFTSNIAFKIIGEHVGQIAVGNINTDCSPINPNSATPYFTIPANGWGSGWAAGYVLRFNSHGAIFPFWNIRTILQSDSSVSDDDFSLQLRGNINKQQQ
ncbi:hypothetical protein [Agarivorans sp. QJM3NY_25]|uniref:hypothetical protein n=1 Tax=Agarivorans sp. QJM3NY_25 TaxID=3421430 RepID=UPI003D7E34A4